jgi:hypothetical protein
MSAKEMTPMVTKLWDEKTLIIGLETETLKLIHSCPQIEPVKKFVEIHDILHMTLMIQEKFPKLWPDLPECDEGALLYLKTLSHEIYVSYWPVLPQPDYDRYAGRLRTLLRVFQIPRETK